MFQLLGTTLSKCMHLQHLLIGLVHKDSPGDDAVYRPETFVHLLANLPPTLRTFTLRLRVLGWRSWLEFYSGAVFAFTAADLLLAPPPDGGGGGGGRFPELERVELRVVKHVDESAYAAPTATAGTTRRTRGAFLPEPPGGRGPREREPSPMPRLHAAGLLRFVYETEDLRAQRECLLVFVAHLASSACWDANASMGLTVILRSWNTQFRASSGCWPLQAA